MTKQLLINGTQEINGKEIKIISGGFGENQKCMLASDIAIQHDMRLDKINTLINNNINRFNSNDIIDFLKPSEGLRNFAKDNDLISSNRTKNVFLLSERGYIKLVSMMDNTNEKKWEVMDLIINDYFSMREIIDKISEKDKLLLGLFSNDKMVVAESHKQLVELEVKEAVAPLEKKIEEDKPLVEFGNQVLKSADNILVRELSKLAFEQGIDIGEKKLYKKLREWKYIMQGCTEPYQSSMNQGLFVVEEKSINTPYGVKLTKTTKVTPKGQVFIIEKLRKEMVFK